MGGGISIKEECAVTAVKGCIKESINDRQAVYDNSNFFTVMQVILGGIIRTLRTQQDILDIHMIQENSVNLDSVVWYGIGT